MANYPLLPLPDYYTVDPPDPGRGFSSQAPSVTPERQTERLGPRFERLERVLSADRQGISLRSDPASIAPERAIVLEVAGSVGDFYTLTRQIAGLEFLADEESEFDPDQDFFEIDTRKETKGQRRTDRRLGGRLYLAMPDVRALQEMISLWNLWKRNEELPYGRRQWGSVFASIREIRAWGIEDRITEDTVGSWRADLASSPADTLRIEAELWYHQSQERRQRSYRSFREMVVGSGGQVIDHAVIPEIGYEAVLIELPTFAIESLIEHEATSIARCDDVMYLRPQSMLDIAEPIRQTADEQTQLRLEPNSALHPIAALLDGMPVQNHPLLQGRLDVDDPEDFESMSVVTERHHGTAMASVIIHGDRNRNEIPIHRRLHVRPVLYAPGNGIREEPRQDKLLIDMIYTAIKRMKDGDGPAGPTAPDVFLVNLSLGDLRRPFCGPISPWAKLLDHLSERFRILFLVSAGNVPHPLPISDFLDWTGFEDADPDDRERAVLTALSNQKAYRTLLSPAEAMNVATVGALHDDAAPTRRSTLAVDPFQDNSLPNISSALGLGHRRVIKPDILLPGGREHVTFQNINGSFAIRPTIGRGLKAAAPDSPGSVGTETLISGTSAATALATRAAHRIFDSLMDTEHGLLHTQIEPRFYAVVTKALLIHRSRWGSCGDILDNLYGPQGRGAHVARRDNIARLIGFGTPDIEQAIECAPNRATLVGHGTIVVGTPNVHRIPLPLSLERVSEPRTITITVAWFSPINYRHKAYRQAKLEVAPVAELKESVGVERVSIQPTSRSTERGAIVHNIFEGSIASSFLDRGNILLQLMCKEQAGPMDQAIDYAVVVTIESGLAVPVYDEVRARLIVPVEARSES